MAQSHDPIARPNWKNGKNGWLSTGRKSMLSARTPFRSLHGGLTESRGYGARKHTFLRRVRIRLTEGWRRLHSETGLTATRGIRKSNPWQLNADQSVSRPFNRSQIFGLVITRAADFLSIASSYLPAKTSPPSLSFFSFFPPFFFLFFFFCPAVKSFGVGKLASGCPGERGFVVDLFAGDISPLNFRVISWRSFFFLRKGERAFSIGESVRERWMVNRWEWWSSFAEWWLFKSMHMNFFFFFLERLGFTVKSIFIVIWKVSTYRRTRMKRGFLVNRTMIIFDDEEIDYKVLCSMLVLNSEWLEETMARIL